MYSVVRIRYTGQRWIAVNDLGRRGAFMQRTIFENQVCLDGLGHFPLNNFIRSATAF